MRYEKPEIVVLASATAEIQGGVKGWSDTIDNSLNHTVGAYDADE